ncbi:MAG: universal stress protein, partial [Lapillicoccus sp.]
MSIVVGYIPTREGRAALRRAAAEAELRKAELIVINSESSKNYDPDDTLRFETALESLRGRLVQAGVDVEVRQLVRRKEP